MNKTARVLFCFLSMALGSTYAQAATAPSLPQKAVSLVMPVQGVATCPTLTTGSNCVRIPRSGNPTDFQNALNSATCGDTIVLAAGSTYSGNFTIPETNCTNNSGWIEIQSNALNSLPSAGNRVSPSNVANMAIISTPNTNPAIAFLPGSNHWRLIGLEITTSYVSTTSTVSNLVLMGYLADNATQQTVASLLPAYVIFDRISILGLSTANVTRGILMDAQSVAVVDGYCDEIHYNGNDSQCFNASNGPGPFLIQNNFIQAGAENILFGGNNVAIANLVPSDITVVGNLLQKNIAWNGEAAPYNWVIKNLFELKTGQRVLIDGNIFQYVWASAQQFAILFRSIDSGSTVAGTGGLCTWCVVQDVTFTHNIIQHVMSGVEIAETDANLSAAQPTARILVQNNLLTDVNSGTWGGHGWAYEIATNNAYSSPHDITIDHNTSFSDSINGAFLALGDSGTSNAVQISNIISDYGAYGIFGAGVSLGTATLGTYVTGLAYNDLAFINFTGTSSGSYPSGTFWNTLSGVGFISYLGTDPDLSGNFQLKTSSPYHNAGTDGKDIGVWDWICLNSDSTAAQAGDFVPNSGCSPSTNQILEPPTNLRAVLQ